MHSSISKEILELQESLNAQGLRSYLYCFDFALLFDNPWRMNEFIKHGGFLEKERDFSQRGQLGGLQIFGGDISEIIEKFKRVYEERGFEFTGVNDLMGFTFNKEGSGRYASFSKIDKGAIVSIYNRF